MTQGRGRIKSAAKRKSPRTHKHKPYITLMIDTLINEADVILEVLDARFIEKSRNKEVENKVKKKGKVLVYVLNKADLIDKNLLSQNIELEGMKPHVFISSKDRDGSLNLRNLIKKYSKRLNKEKVNIGVIGYPNSGKSSLINYLTGRGSAKTSSEAGFTKGIQKLKLSTGIYLIDTPGVIPLHEKASITQENIIKLQKIGATNSDSTKDPDLVVLRLMQEYPNIIENHYGIDAEGNSEVLLEKLGKKLNYLKKGGEIDEITTAKKVIRDWQEGKIKLQ